MNERLIQFLAAENISQSQFAETIGVARASVSHIIAGRNRPGYDFICSILERYPSLNPEWILLGKGKMYKTSSVRDSEADSAPVSLSGPEPQPAPVSQPAPADYPASAQAALPESEPAAPIASAAPLASVTGAAGAAAYPGAMPAAPAPDGRYHGPENPSAGRTVTRIVVFYSDNTFQELHG